MVRKTAIASLLLLLGTLMAAGQETDSRAATISASPAITFLLDWPVQKPPRYSVSVTNEGAAVFQDPPQSQGQTEDAYSLEWTMSQALRTQIFDLAKKANFFQGTCESKIKVAQTGKKTLSFRDGSRQTSCTYNYSEDKSVQELTRLFQGIAFTVDMGRRLEHDARFDHLGLNAQLKTLQDEQKRGGALEIQAIQPILQRIVNNRGLMNLAQQRAAQILKDAGLPSQSGTTQGGG